MKKLKLLVSSAFAILTFGLPQKIVGMDCPSPMDQNAFSVEQKSTVNLLS